MIDAIAVFDASLDAPWRRRRGSVRTGFLDLIAAGTISGKIAKDLFEIVWSEGGDPRERAKRK